MSSLLCYPWDHRRTFQHKFWCDRQQHVGGKCWRVCALNTRGKYVHMRKKNASVPLRAAVLSILDQQLFKGEGGGSMKSWGVCCWSYAAPASHTQQKALTSFRRPFSSHLLLVQPIPPGVSPHPLPNSSQSISCNLIQLFPWKAFLEVIFATSL